MALKLYNPPAGLMHHSNRGSQYASRDYKAMIEMFYNRQRIHSQLDNKSPVAYKQLPLVA